MELPVHDKKTYQARPAADVRAMGIAVQANLVQLKVVDSRRRNLPTAAHEIKVPSPGHVARFRETLIDHSRLRGYSDEQIQLRLREIWGRFCLLRWAFQDPGVDATFDFAKTADDAPLHCDARLWAKQAEIHAVLWRLRFEQRLRGDPDYPGAPRFATDERWARDIPARAHRKPLCDCTDEELLAASCEHAGMLGAIRWVLDRSSDWSDPDLMTAADQPFISESV